ncbi:hypothetical protein KGQ20_42695 [Catenulispora sp. NF23]|uniref:Uncharacterized protein n=1 Tax=Catenulispora pinistramenti TaxID=2705254 RepID=A0ABS5KJJ0_9ACTN|nr:hypothetical protein [Catenulispora pinistramenti]MBS2539474.1 hypothetical protein [Catenulispora pinistramenti]MBS2546195.1 hypothetical protein [Catenulispora pinistramenti]
MADDDVPDDLVQLKRSFWAADKQCAELADRPDSTDPEVQAAMNAELSAARAERSRITTGLYAHPWWATQANRYQADQRVNAAARALDSA